MSWVRIEEGADIGLRLALAIRLLALRLHRVYRIFFLFLVSELAFSLAILVKDFAPDALPDYRLMWITIQTIVWIFTLATVYALLDTVLAKLPGILGFSRKLLNGTFAIAILLGLASARPEYLVSGAAGLTGIDRLVGIWIVLDRAICTVALLSMVSILGFLLWFPVEISKNLLVFSTGFFVYFAAKTGLFLTRSFFSHESRHLVSNLVMFISSACLAYWAMFLSCQGETVPVRVGHIWHRREQERLVGQLEAMNAALLRAAARR